MTKSVAPISDLITGTVLYNKLVEDIIAGETELSITEYRILFFLAESAEKQARIHTLAEALVLNSSTVSDAVKDLEAKGLVRKADHHNDLKAVWAAITEEGEATFTQCNSVLIEYTREYWDIIGTEARKSYFTFGARLMAQSPYPIQAASELPGAAYYPFVSRRYLLSYVNWFKSTYNLSLIDVRILMILLEHRKKLSCASIAHLLKVSNSAISNAVRRLSRVRHYVSRTKSAATHQIDVELTEEGTRTIREIRERFIRFNLSEFNISLEEFETMLLTVHPRHQKSYMQKVFGEEFSGPC